MSLSAIPARLLLVEDEPDILLPVQAVLEEEGYAVTPAVSLPASLEQLEEHVYHLVLTDLFSPNGHAPLQSIRPLLTKAVPTPVAVMTSWPMAEEAAAQAGVSFLLHKPFNLDDLVRAVQREIHPQSNHTRQTQVIEQFFAALNAHDWKQLARLCTPDVALRSISAPAVEVSESKSGLLTYRAYIEQRFSTLPGYTIDEVRVYGRPLGVAARYIARWQDRDGIIHRMAGSLHFRFKGERIAQIEGVF
ncbi:MAG TPA: response regulator [Ktedonobacterales bacterium]|jgi:CheY-like chemotaxis protein